MATVKNSTYSIGKIKTFIGMEGHGLNAQILKDGKPIAFVLDDANGGEVQFDFTNPAQNAASYQAHRETHQTTETECKAFCHAWWLVASEMAESRERRANWYTTFPDSQRFDCESHYAMEEWFEHQFSLYITERELKKLLSKRIAFVNKDKPRSVLQTKVLTANVMARLLGDKAYIAKQEAENLTVLNLLPFADALNLYRAGA